MVLHVETIKSLYCRRSVLPLSDTVTSGIFFIKEDGNLKVWDENGAVCQTIEFLQKDFKEIYSSLKTEAIYRYNYILKIRS